MCSDDTDFEEKTQKTPDVFINRHYPDNIIKQILDLIKLIPRQQMLQPNRVTAAEERLILNLLDDPWI